MQNQLSSCKSRTEHTGSPFKTTSCKNSATIEEASLFAGVRSAWCQQLRERCRPGQAARRTGSSQGGWLLCRWLNRKWLCRGGW